MNDSISSIETTELTQLQAVSFKRAAPLGIIEIVHSMSEKALFYTSRQPLKMNLASVTRKHEGHNRSSKRTQEATLPVLAKTKSPKMTLKKLTDHGFVELAEKMRSKSGPPWDGIMKYTSPHLIEQLYDLATLIEIKQEEGTTFDAVHCMNYGLVIATETDTCPSPLLGKYIHLLDRDPEYASLAASSSKGNEWIEIQFNSLIKQTIATLERLKRKHRKAKLQSHDIAYRNQLPIELSNYLISSTNHLNIGLVEPLIEIFTESPRPLLDYETHLSLTLRQLAGTPSLREKLCHMKAPKSPGTPANIVIRATLGLRPEQKLLNIDASRAALTSLLTMLRQGKDGSCFATPLAICLMNSHLDLCLNDFQQLMAESKLSRIVDGVYVDFPFILKIGDQNLSKKIRISRAGQLVLPGGKLIPLSRIPGITAVKTAMGIEKIKITKYLFSKSREEQPYIDTTLKELLQALVKQAKTLPLNEKTALSQLYLNAVFSYMAQEWNPLLQVWENSIACMAEADEKSMVRSSILKSSHNVLASFLKNLLDARPDLLHEAAVLFNTYLNEKMHLQWDPHIASDLASDQESTEGAFVLYDKGDYSKPTRWQRLDSPTSYQSFILRIIDEVGKEMHKLFEDINWKIVEKTLISLETYVESEKFLQDSLIDYYPPNADIPHILEKQEHLSYAPWITKSGNSLQKVLQVYFERPDLKAQTRLSPKNGKELLEALILTLKSSDSSRIGKIRENSHFCSPVRIPYVHAFTLLPGHRTFSAAWNSSMEPEDWIERNVIRPGREVSNSSLPEDAKDSIIEQISAGLVQRKDRSLFMKAMRQLPEELSIKEFRQALLNFIRKKQFGIKLPLQSLEVRIDQEIYTYLPRNLKEKLHASAVHIGDTNWADGVNALHFSLVVNPGTGQIVLWGIRDDSSLLIPFDQSVWFENNSWELFVI